MTLLYWVVGTATVWAAAFAAYIFAVRARWLSRFEKGFLFEIAIALVGIALMSASVVGVWGYRAAGEILDDALVVEMQDIGAIVEREVASELDDIQRQLKNLGTALADARDRGASAAELKQRLVAAQSFDSEYLQLRLVSPDGLEITDAVADDGAGEPPNRIAIAFGQEGKPFTSDAYYSPAFKRQVLLLYVPVSDAAGKLRLLISARFDLAAEFESLIGSAKFNESGYAVLVDGEGQIVAHPDKSKLDTNLSDYPAVRAARASQTVGTVVARNAQGINRLFVYRALRNPATMAQQPWVLLTEVDRDEELAGLRRLRRELAAGIVLVLIGGLLIAHQVSRSVTDPLKRLGEFAKQIGTGDLTTRTTIAGRDVSGRLAATLNEMADGLQERDHVKEVFGRYIATQVSDKILKGQVNLGGESKRISILFSDIRNFTGMSETLTPQQVVTFLNDYFSEMVDAVFENGGILDKFIGDGLMAVFGALDEGDHEQRAVRTALRMKALLGKINGARGMHGLAPIAIGIGIHTDEVIVGNIGSRKRLEYTVVGDGVNTSSRLQGLNKDFGTTILISETTYAAIKDDFVCRQMPEAHLRGKSRNLQFYEVLSAKSESVAAAAAPLHV
jgi:class 3 adenylate cyclase